MQSHIKLTNSNLLSWKVVYDPFSDLFQFFDNSYFKMSNADLKTIQNNNIRIIYNSKSSDPVLLEIKNAYDTLGVDLDNQKKEDIIKLVEPYFSHIYGQA